MNWPSTTTRQIHTKDPNLFTKLFGNITHTHASNILAFGGIGSGYLHTDSMQFLWHHTISKKYLFSQIVFKTILSRP
jgi:hypothetical protein